MNPTDQARKEARKRELKKNKKQISTRNSFKTERSNTNHRRNVAIGSIRYGFNILSELIFQGLSIFEPIQILTVLENPGKLQNFVCVLESPRIIRAQQSV